MKPRDTDAPAAIVADRWFDGRVFRRERVCIHVAGGRIARIEALADGDVLRREVLDARGSWVIPGLINTHVHISRGGMFGPVEPISIPQVVRNLRFTLAAGVTTVGDMGCTAGLIAALRSHTARSAAAGPSIYAAGPLVTAPGGYPLDWLPRAYARLGVARQCATALDACRAANAIAAAGMNHVKVAVMHEGYGGAALRAVSVDALAALVSEAHRLGLHVLAHAHSVADYRVALEGKVDGLMHSSFEPLDDEMVRRVRDAGIPVCPTLWVFESACLGPAERWDLDDARGLGVAAGIRREWRQYCEAWSASGDVIPEGIAGGRPKARALEGVRVAAANLRLLRDAGVPVVFGNDAAYGFSTHARPVDELCTMVRAGMNTREVLESATTRAAALLRCKEVGAVAPGMRADLVAIDGDLESNLEAVANVRWVMRDGVGAAGELAPRGADVRGELASAGAVARGLIATAAHAVLRG